MLTPTSLPSAAPDPSDPTSASSLPQLSDEWTTSRELIAKFDDRIHDTRKVVFGLFSALLTAGSFFCLFTRGTNSAAPVSVPFALLLLFLSGRFFRWKTVAPPSA